MEKQNQKELMKIFYKNKTVIKTLAITILIAIFCIAIGVIIDNRKQQAIEVEDCAKTGEYATTTAYYISDYFATYEVDNSVQDKYYIAICDGFFCILNMSDSDYNSQSPTINDEANADGVKLYGITEDISSNLKDYAIDSLNELYEGDVINVSNFDEYFAPYVINCKRGPNDISIIFYVVADTLLILDVIIGISYLMQIRKSKKNIKKAATQYDLSQVIMELSEEKTEFNGTKTMFLQNYLISYANNLEILKYTDIVWAYPHTNRVNGVDSNYQIYVMTKDEKRHSISYCSARKRKEYNETYEELIARTPNALTGYTSENIRAMSKKNRKETISQIEEKQ